MAENPKLTAINIGGKGTSLTSNSIFSIANKLVKVRIDSSLLDKLQSSSISTSNYQVKFSENLTLEESRASLIVFLVKLLHSTTSIKAEIPNLIIEALNSCSDSVIVDQIDVSEEEKGVLDNCLSIAPLVGICALLDYGVSALSSIAEVVAALSCEAENAKVSVFNLVDSGDGKCLKDEAGVASDIKVLLNGSKLVGKVEVEAVSSIPEVFGSFREVSRAVHSRVRVGLNCGVKDGVSGIGKAWGAVLSSLATVLRNLGEGSVTRVGLNVDSVGSDGLKLSLKHLIDEKCPNFKSLRDAFKVVSDAAFEEEYVNLVHSANALFGLVKSVVLWELVTAFVSLEGSDLLERKQGDAKVDKKKKKVLGKGTGVVLQLIKDRLPGSFVGCADEFVAVEKLAEEIHSMLDSKVIAVGDFLERIKEVVESNETRRLPKLAKVTTFHCLLILISLVVSMHVLPFCQYFLSCYPIKLVIKLLKQQKLSWCPI